MNDSVGDGPLLRDVTPRGCFEETKFEGQRVGGGGSMVPGDSVRLTSAMMDPWSTSLICCMSWLPIEVRQKRLCTDGVV
jgi:hypothetical protein